MTHWIAELSARLARPPLRPSLASGYTDFGRHVLPLPEVMVQTTSVDEVLIVLDVARQNRIPVAVRGSGHSSGGHTAAPRGIVLQHEPEGPSPRLRGNLVEVPGHWRWTQVESYLRASQRDLVVATSSVDTTVAGTLSVGGFGVRSVRHGPQVDHVHSLRLIGANGDVAWCCATERCDWFAAALTGLGQVGVIDRVVLETAPFRPYLAVTSETHACFAELAERSAWMAEPQADAPDYFCALAKQGQIQSTLASAHGTHAEATRPEARRWLERASSPRHDVLEASAFERDERQMPLAHWRNCRNIWADYCFEAASFGAFARFVDLAISSTLTDHLAYVLCVEPRREFELAFDMRPASSRRLFSLGLFYSVPAEDTQEIALAHAMQRLALDKCLELGGRPYLHGCWGGANGLDQKTLRETFGSGCQNLLALRQRLDPLGLLNAGAVSQR